MQQKDHELTNQLYEKQLNQQAEKGQQALMTQAEKFQESAKRQNEAESQKIRQLQSALQEKSTTGDVNQISPAAEANLRKSVAQEYGKVQQADMKRNERRTDTIQDEYKNLLSESEQRRITRETQLQRSVASERQNNFTTYNDHIADTEANKLSQLHNQEEQHLRETELLNKNYARAMNRQNLQHQETAAVLQDDASSRINAIRQEAEFNSKMAQHAFSVRQNELIREYEKKLADQKTDLREPTGRCQGAWPSQCS